jgi:hypothetical protein
VVLPGSTTFLVCQKKGVGATIGRLQILPKQNLSLRGEKTGYFPSENPKNIVFRRAINDRPYILKRKQGSLTV